MYGMTREEAADTALVYHRLVEDVRRIHAYLLSTMPLGTVLEIMRPVERVLLDSALSETQRSPVAWRYRYGPKGTWKYADDKADCNPSPNYEQQPLYLRADGGTAMVPEGMVLVPRELTAENGAKSALLGEFHLDCYEGTGNEGHVVPWDTIKEIHRRMVSLFAAPSLGEGKS